jgi:hypothetical protein
MASYSGQSKDPVVLKVLIDAAYFASLQKAEKLMQQHTDKKIAADKKQHNQESSTENNQTGSGATKENNQTGSAKENNQTGSGAKNTQERTHTRRPPVDEETLRRVLTEVINKELAAYFEKEQPPTNIVEYFKDLKLKDLSSLARQLPFIKNIIGQGQIGHGAVDSDVLQPTTDNLPEPEGPPDRGAAIYSELGQPQPSVDKQAFLHLVPSEWQAKANKLLDWIEENPMLVRWDFDGVITIEGEQIPHTDIYTAFEQLYSTHPDFKVPGYVGLASLILDSGLGSLICKASFSFNSRKRKFNLKQDSYKVKNKVTPWYYIND